MPTTNHNFITIPVADGSEIDLYIALPEGKGPFPAIIVFQEAFGVNHHIQQIAERLCKEGYAAVAPDLFHRTGRRVEIAYTDFAAAMPHYQALTKAGLQDDSRASYAWLQGQPTVAHDKIAAIGFCLGGRVSFLANATLPLAAGISYYGGGLDALADEAVNLHGPQLFFWGGKDAHLTEDKRNAIIHAMDKAGKPYTNAVFSTADHAFNSDERPSYQPDAAKESWAMSLAFLANKFK